MKKINLLPPQIVLDKKARKLKIWMAALQVAIFLGIGAIVLVLQTVEQRTSSNLQELRTRIANLDERPFELVLELEEMRTIERHFDLFFAENFPTTFNTEWITTILETLPYNASLTQFNYRQIEILLNGEVENIEDIETHRQGILNSELFEYVWLGQMRLLENGRYSYELRIRVKNDDE